jgi:hypothetical protein
VAEARRPRRKGDGITESESEEEEWHSSDDDDEKGK